MVDCKASPDKNEAPKAGAEATEAGASGVVSGAGVGGDGSGSGSGCTGGLVDRAADVVEAVFEVVAVDDVAALGFGYISIYVRVRFRDYRVRTFDTISTRKSFSFISQEATDLLSGKTLPVCGLSFTKRRLVFCCETD